MIEDIKKEIDKDKYTHWVWEINYRIPYIKKSDVKEILDKYNNQEENNEDSPYCETCGHCGHIGCCGIKSFINNHIKGKTNCKNEEGVIADIIDLCSYQTEVFKENDELEKYKKAWKEFKDYYYLAKESDNNLILGGKIYAKIYELEQKHNLGGNANETTT